MPPPAITQMALLVSTRISSHNKTKTRRKHTVKGCVKRKWRLTRPVDLFIVGMSNDKKRVYMDRKGSRTTSGRASRPKKRTFNGNEFNKSIVGSSCEKTKLENYLKQCSQPDYDDPNPNHGYKILNFLPVFAAVSSYVKCETCNGKVNFSESHAQGLGFELVISCGKCKDRTVGSSPVSRTNTYEINERYVFAMRMLGEGLTGARLFCGLMDLPKPPVQQFYDRVVNHVRNATAIVARASMHRAMMREISETEADHGEAIRQGIAVSANATWKKDGSSAIRGMAMLIGGVTGKVIDAVSTSTLCKPCESWKSRSGTEAYVEWLNEHEPECTYANFKRSTSEMETDGINELFKRSEDLYGTKYLRYIEDGDDRIFDAVSDAQPYGEGVVIEETNCVAHLEKQFRNRLRALKRERSDLRGKGKLSAGLIDELTVSYGLAMKSNNRSINDMRNSIWATYYHRCSTDDNPQHQYCLLGDESSCTWQRAGAKGLLENHKHIKTALDPDVQTALKPIYEEFCKKEVLGKCIGGLSRTNIESLNAKIREAVPDIYTCGTGNFETAVYMAISTFNEGSDSYLRALRYLGMEIGSNATEAFMDSKKILLLASAREARAKERNKRKVEGVSNSTAKVARVR